MSFIVKYVHYQQGHALSGSSVYDEERAALREFKRVRRSALYAELIGPQGLIRQASNREIERKVLIDSGVIHG